MQKEEGLRTAEQLLEEEKVGVVEMKKWKKTQQSMLSELFMPSLAPTKMR